MGGVQTSLQGFETFRTFCSHPSKDYLIVLARSWQDFLLNWSHHHQEVFLLPPTIQFLAQAK
jgi:hypothetical protein